MNPTRIIAFDPGGDTGWAKYKEEDGKRTITKGEFGYDNHHDTIYTELGYFQPDLVVTERFDYRGKKKSVELISVEYIGVMRLWCDRGGVDLVEQTQLKGKTGLWTDDKLKVLGLYTPTVGGHANDAVRQLLYYITITLQDNHYVFEYERLANAEQD